MHAQPTTRVYSLSFIIVVIAAWCLFHHCHHHQVEAASAFARKDYFLRLDGFPYFDPSDAPTPCGSDCKVYELNKLKKQLIATSESPPSSWNVGADITSRTELVQSVGKFVAPILYGGLGNELFQLAALHVYGRVFNIPVVTGYFHHWNRMYQGFGPWGGHPSPFNCTDISLKTVFPALQWVSQRDLPIDNSRVFNHYAFKLHTPDEYYRLPKTDVLPAYVHGYFFNSKYWHHHRSYVLGLFRFHPAIDAYIHAVYGSIFQEETEGNIETVSVHLRFGYSGEPGDALLVDRDLPSKEYFTRAFASSFGTPKVKKYFLVFADNIDKAWAFMHNLDSERVANDVDPIRYTVVDENMVVTLAMMRQCTHHVLTSSTLSFWGAYLNEKQSGHTIVPSVFFSQHGKDMIPRDFLKSNKWVIWKASPTHTNRAQL
eukprot:m.3033 g.3033  ORF g.3033 m.3033 type:complete len:429 (+) comp3163_c0_seq1:51-1337(+)